MTFVIYMNDLQECELSSSVLLYADDTSLPLSAIDPATLEEKLNKDIDEVQKWLQKWGMGKSQCARLQRLQLNRAGRIITFSDYNT